jgi:hypothetical protein
MLQHHVQKRQIKFSRGPRFIYPAAQMEEHEVKAWKFLPKINTPQYHLLLSCSSLFILGPLGGISAAYMNFSLGFFVCGQVLAGILGSVVTFGYGPEGRHGANYIQTMSASVADMAGMAVLIQAMVWLGLKEPPVWQLILYFTCIGMFGVGVGMLYTPILVDRMQLTFPSGFAVANILRALTDKKLLKQSIAKLGGGTLGGLASGLFPKLLALCGTIGAKSFFSKAGEMFDRSEFMASTLGAGMIVGARISIPPVIVAIIGYCLTPWIKANGWIGPNDRFRKIGFIVALGTILGAAAVDLSLIGWQAVRRWKEGKSAAQQPQEDWKKVNTTRLILWIIFWAGALAFVASGLLHQPLGFVLFAIGLVFVFLMINGIAQGISDWNPISSAFVVAVFLMASMGLKDPGIGLMCASILLISCNSGVDMQQDRSTGWRLGTNRVVQFRYQVVGILMGAVLAVALAKIFMHSYPVLRVNTFAHPETPGADKWQSAMTFKFVGALEDLTHPKPFIMTALQIGMAGGFVIELLRKIIKGSTGYQRFAKASAGGRAADFTLDAIVLPSPYASSFGGFVNLATVAWFGVGGVITLVLEHMPRSRQVRHPHAPDGELPADMNTPSLVGGGLIAGDSLAALGIGLYGLLGQLFS